MGACATVGLRAEFAEFAKEDPATPMVARRRRGRCLKVQERCGEVWEGNEIGVE